MNTAVENGTNPVEARGKDENYKPEKQQENESAPTGFLRGAAYYGGDDHAE